MYSIEEIREFFAGDRFATEQTGIVIDEVTEEYAKCSLKLDERHYGAHGQVMGGVVFTLADFTFAVSVNSPEEFVATVNSNISYISSPKGSVLYGKSEKIRKSKRVCFYRIQITDDTGALIAVIENTGMRINKQ
ncbi:MAG: PaaI family thioesterase [Clostridiales bacterium]|nr:PaaI family thioesterase [Clostridiales bacterium]